MRREKNGDSRDAASPADTAHGKRRLANYAPRDERADRLTTELMLTAESLAFERTSARGTPNHPVHALDLTKPREPRTDDSPLGQLISEIRTRLVGSENLFGLLDLEQIPEALGTPEYFSALYSNLYPVNRPTAVILSARTSVSDTKLTSRECEIVGGAAIHETNADIAARLSISTETVRKHFGNIFEKLKVSDRRSAVVRARSLGYLNEPESNVKVTGLRILRPDHNSFQTFCCDVGEVNPDLLTANPEPLVPFGLFLILLGAAIARTKSGNMARPRPGALCQIKPSGAITRSVRPAGLGICRDIAIAPAAAGGHGFTPGALYVAHDIAPQCGLNRAAISEFTSDGRYVRTFCGGRDVATRLIGPVTLAFDMEGKLLVTSSWLTTAILAFTNGGAEVRRFAEGQFHQVTTGPDGLIYGALSTDLASMIRVFDPVGKLVRTYGEMLDRRHFYFSLAVDSDGYSYATTNHPPAVNVFDSAGKPAGDFYIKVVTGLLALDARDRLVVPNSEVREVSFLARDGALLSRLDLHNRLEPLGSAPCPDGSIWVCGRAV